MVVLSDAAIGRLGVGPAVIRTALAEAFRLHAARRTVVLPKASLPIGPGHFFQSMSALSRDLGFAAHKWVGVAAGNAARGLPTVDGLVVLSDVETGRPAALLGGNALTVLRTAGMSALAARHLARPDSRSLGFVGCGEQAAGHLPAMLDVLPGIEAVVCCSGSAASAERLAMQARAAGVAATTARDPEAALACDVVVTSVRTKPDLRPFLHARDLRPGSFVTAVDLGASWIAASLGTFDLAATDDLGQAAEPSTRARLAFPGPFDADLAGLVTRPELGRSSPDQRALFLFPGFALADLAVAAAILKAATEAGAGLVLP